MRYRRLTMKQVKILLGIGGLKPPLAGQTHIQHYFASAFPQGVELRREAIRAEGNGGIELIVFPAVRGGRQQNSLPPQTDHAIPYFTLDPQDLVALPETSGK